jgi:HK97 family phage major capsid protein
MKEIQDNVENLHKTVADFMTVNSAVEMEKKLKGYVDPLLKTQWDKMQDAIDKHEVALEEAKKEAQDAKDGLMKAQALIKKGMSGKGRKQLSEKDIAIKSAMETYIKKGENGLRHEERELMIEHTKAMTAFVGADGGYSVRPQFDSKIIEKIRETSPIRQYAEVITVTSDRIEEPSEGDDFDSGWVGELEDREETNTGTLDMVEIDVHEQYAMPRVTQKLLDDAYFNVEEYLTRKIASKFERVENAAFVNGDGIKKPRGFLTYANGTSFNTIEQVNSGVDGDVSVQGLYDLYYNVKDFYLQGAVWMMPRSVIRLFRGLLDGQGRPLWAPAFGGTPSTIMEHPVVMAQDMPAPAAGSKSIIFGNFREAYRIVDRMGTRILRDNVTKKGHVKFYTTKRCGGGVKNFDALKIQVLSA